VQQPSTGTPAIQAIAATRNNESAIIPSSYVDPQTEVASLNRVIAQLSQELGGLAAQSPQI